MKFAQYIENTRWYSIDDYHLFLEGGSYDDEGNFTPLTYGFLAKGVDETPVTGPFVVIAYKPAIPGSDYRWTTCPANNFDTVNNFKKEVKNNYGEVIALVLGDFPCNVDSKDELELSNVFNFLSKIRVLDFWKEKVIKLVDNEHWIVYTDGIYTCITEHTFYENDYHDSPIYFGLADDAPQPDEDKLLVESDPYQEVKF